MENISLLIGLIGLAVGAIGIIPIIIEYEKYVEILKNSLSSEEFIYTYLHVIYDIQSKENVKVYKTGKLKLKKKNPTLILGRISDYGKAQSIRTKVDNIQIDNSFEKNAENIDLMKRDIFNKRIGETIVIEDESEFILEDKDKEVNNDGFYEIIKPFNCKHLLLTIIFPSNYRPNQLRFAESNLEEDDEKKIKYYEDDSSQLTCFSNNRKLAHWSIKYPKRNHKYGVFWRWKPK